MACLRITLNNREIERRDLSRPLVIGRAPECDLSVRDVLLSRRHCRIAPSPDDRGVWFVIDLGSKNGTTLNGKRLNGAARMSNGDELLLGRVRMRFNDGKLADMGLTSMRYTPTPARPSDPVEASSGSGTFFAIGLLDEEEFVPGAHVPRPRPQPKAPAAFEREDLYSFLNTLASSSWDSIYAEARQPLASNRPAEDGPIGPPRARPRSPMDLSLQADFRAPRTRHLHIRRMHIPRPRVRTMALCVVLLALVVIRCWPGGQAAAPGPRLAAASVRPATVVTPGFDPRLLEAQGLCAALPLIL
ncbi:MAG TPA: FHA domain-containing protein [Tepidisphaeraceae bacterium]|nr:FHA domain-containing protein [Tepidisphaeraceae bacterium]